MVCLPGCKQATHQVALRGHSKIFRVEHQHHAQNVEAFQLESKCRASVAKSLIINSAFKLAAVLGHFARGWVGDEDAILGVMDLSLSVVGIPQYPRLCWSGGFSCLLQWQ